MAVGVMGAREALAAAQTMKGDENAVIAVADKWREAAKKITKAEEPLSRSWNSLTADWSGGAYDAFKVHMSRNSKVAEDNAAALFAAEGALLELSLKVAEAYNLAVDLTTTAATLIQPALAGLGALIGEEPDKPTISRALSSYVAGINQIDTSLRTALSTQKVGLAKFLSEVSKLKQPGEFSEGMGDPRRWIYR